MTNIILVLFFWEWLIYSLEEMYFPIQLKYYSDNS